MQLFVFSVYDKAVKAYLQPFYARARGEALRSFTQAVNDRQHNFNKHAADYLLVQLGSFDDVVGMFQCGEPERLVSALECLIPDDPFTNETKEMEASPGNVRKLPM